MASKIFRSILTVAIVVLLASLTVIIGVLYPYFGSLQQTQMKDDLRFAAQATEQLGESYLNTLAFDRYRLTWVAQDGTVLFDSSADAAAMENHADREEIREALRTGAGSGVRYSTTLLEQTMYEAVRLQDGTVLRISASRVTVLVLVLGMLSPIALILVTAVALSAWLAQRMAKRAVEPLNNLDLEAPLENEAYDEIAPLLNRIHAQHQEIGSQMRALKRKQDEFDQITGNMREALVVLDAGGRVVSINPAAGELFDADAGCIGCAFQSIEPGQDMWQAIAEAREKGYALFRKEIKGREYRFDLSRIDSDGSVQGIVILAFDVTEQINAERNRREFTANVSHELKTPLQSIIGSAELLENGIVKPEDTPRFVGRIRQEATRLVSLINDIIRLAQLDEGSSMPHEEVSLRALAEEVCETLADAAREKAVVLCVSGEDAVLYGVRRLLFEVIYNLCDNAVKYNNPGGSVEVSVGEDDRFIRLCVKDNGIGIAPEHQEKIFERFYRVDKSHSRQSGGTGLGLSIVKHAVQYHRGKIEISSELGKGSAISVLFDKNAETPEN